MSVHLLTVTFDHQNKTHTSLSSYFEQTALRYVQVVFRNTFIYKWFPCPAAVLVKKHNLEKEFFFYKISCETEENCRRIIRDLFT